MKLKNINIRKIMNKYGQQSTGFVFIFGLVSLFGVGVLYIIFNQVFEAHLVPTIKGMVNGSTANFNLSASTVSSINGHIDNYMDFFHLLPYVLFLVIVLYIGIKAFQSESQTQYQ